MQKVVVQDAGGVRWSVGARRLRRGESCRPWPGPEEESLRRRLAAALSPAPRALPDPAPGRPATGWTPGDTSDIALREALTEYDIRPGIAALGELAWMVHDLVVELRRPWSDSWQVEARAHGRIRRWARWEVDGPAATARAVTTVSAALAAGAVPGPDRGVLVDVVDQRPPLPSLRSAGPGDARPGG